MGDSAGGSAGAGVGFDKGGGGPTPIGGSGDSGKGGKGSGSYGLLGDTKGGGGTPVGTGVGSGSVPSPPPPSAPSPSYAVGESVGGAGGPMNILPPVAQYTPAGVGDISNTGTPGGVFGDLGYDTSANIPNPFVNQGVAPSGGAPGAPTPVAPGGGPGPVAPVGNQGTPGGTGIGDLGATATPATPDATGKSSSVTNSIVNPTGIRPTQAALPGATGAPPGGTSGTGNDITNAKKSDDDFLKKFGITNPAQTAIGLAGLGLSLGQGNKQPQYTPEMIDAAQKALDQAAQLQQQASGNALTPEAKQLYQQGQDMIKYVQTGELPEGVRAQLTQATDAAKKKIISNFAAQGLSTDPTQNSVLAQQLAQVDQQAIITEGQLQQQYLQGGLSLVQAAQQWTQTSAQLVQAGVQATGLAADIYKQLAAIDQTQQAKIGDAISNFARALGGTSGGVNIKVG